MTRPNYTRRALIGGLAAIAAAPALATAPVSSLRPPPRPAPGLRTGPSAEALIRAAGLSGDVSFAVADLRTGEMLEARKPLLRQPPASTAKVLTALYALEALGPEHRFATRVIATGPVHNGRVEGDVVLVGGGDPTLDTGGLGALAAEFKAVGVHEVRGAFRVHPGPLPQVPEIDPEQPSHVGYNPAVGGLNLNFNRVHFEWARASGGYEVKLDARSAGFSPRVDTSRMRVVDRRVPVYTYEQGDGVDEWTVSRAALGRGGARWLPVRSPELYAAEVFQTLARSHGIVLRLAELQEAPPQGVELARRESPPLAAILRDMLRYSTNLTAEVVGLAASAALGPMPPTLAASAARMNAWLGEELGGRRPALVDHSGLGDASRITAADMANAMVRVGPEGPLAPLLTTFRGAEGRPISAVAKTGTLNFVSALAGYLTCPDGRELAFSILTSDLDRRSRLSVDERERPEGGRAWASRSRALQRDLLAAWSSSLAA